MMEQAMKMMQGGGSGMDQAAMQDAMKNPSF
jgi:hypothetical protein